MRCYSDGFYNSQIVAPTVLIRASTAIAMSKIVMYTLTFSELPSAAKEVEAPEPLKRTCFLVLVHISEGDSLHDACHQSSLECRCNLVRTR